MNDPNNLPIEKRCSECGAVITTEAAEGLCVACLLRQAAEATDVAATGSYESSGYVNSADTPEITIDAVRNAFPNLEIIAKVGQGGMGAVFKARQPVLNRFVALKILSLKLSRDERFSARFLREAQFLARLNHPNIVAVHEFGESNGLYYLIMEYVDGVNLRQAIHSATFTPEQTLQIVPKICEALQYAHEEGVLHRDIKPENILLDAKGRVKIADFGIASVARWTAKGATAPGENPLPLVAGINDEKLTQAGQILGTPNYMAPEQFEQAANVDHRADIYSLGVVFYELLTGELPHGHLTPPSSKTPVDHRIDEIVFKALEKEREKRQQSAAELKTDLETVAATLTPPTLPPTGPVPGKRLPIIGLALVLLPLFLCLPLATVFFTARSVSYGPEIREYSIPAASAMESAAESESSAESTVESIEDTAVHEMGPLNQVSRFGQDEPAGPSRLVFLVLILLIGTMLISPIIGTILGWIHIGRIAKSSMKTLWFLGMVDALLWPFFILWFILWLSFYGLFSAPFIGTEFRFIAETCGGLSGTFIAFGLMFLIYWKVLRWIFPKPPSPARLAYTAVSLLAVGAFFFCIGLICIDGENAFARYLYARHEDTKESYEKKLELYRTEIEKETYKLENSANEHEKRSAEFHLEHMQRNLVQETERKDQELERIAKDNRVYEIGFAIILGLCLFSGGLILVIATICGWVHLIRIRKNNKRPGLVPAAIVALLPAIPLVWAVPFSCIAVPFLAVQPWGPYGSAALMAYTIVVSITCVLGSLAGLVAVYFFLRWVYRWYFGDNNEKDGVNGNAIPRPNTDHENAVSMADSKIESVTNFESQKNETEISHRPQNQPRTIFAILGAVFNILSFIPALLMFMAIYLNYTAGADNSGGSVALLAIPTGILGMLGIIFGIIHLVIISKSPTKPLRLLAIFDLIFWPFWIFCGVMLLM